MPHARIVFTLCVFLLMNGTTSLAQTTATWTGGGTDDLYSNPDNWSLGGDVPINDGTTYWVVIPAGQNVVFDVAGSSAVDSLTVGTNGTFTVEPGAELNVIGGSVVGGQLLASGAGASLVATGPGSSVLGDTQFLVTSGSSIFSSASQFDSSGGPSGGTIWNTQGIGSTLDLSSLLSYVDGEDFSGTPTRSIVVGDQGTMDLSNLESFVGGDGNDVLELQIAGDGVVHLDALDTIEGIFRFDIDNPSLTVPVLTHATFTEFALDSNAIELPALTELDAASFEISAGGLFNAPNLGTFTSSEIALDPTFSFVTSPLSDIDGSRIAVSGGLEYTGVSATSYDYSGSSIPSSGPIFSVDGLGSILDLSSLTTFVDGQNFAGIPTRSIAATNDGIIDLSSVESLFGAPTSDLLAIQIADGGTILLDALETVVGNVLFDIDNPSYTVPALSSATFTEFQIDSNSMFLPLLVSLDAGAFGIAAGGHFDAPGLTALTASEIALDPLTSFVTGNLSDIDGTRFSISGGLAYDDVTASSYVYSGSSLVPTTTVLSASGAGSVLDLSSLVSFTDGQNFSGAQTRTILASDEGTIDLSGVESLIGGNAAGNDYLTLRVAGNGTVLLGALETIEGRFRLDVDNSSYSLPSLDSADFTVFEVDSNALDLPTLTHLDAASFQITAGGLFDAPNLTGFTASELAIDPTVSVVTGALSSVDGSRFMISGGLEFTSVTADSYSYAGTSLSAAGTLLSADGPGSLLDLSSLLSYVDGQNFSGSQSRSIVASNQGTIDFSGLLSLVGSSGNDQLVLQIGGGGDIDLSALETIEGNLIFDLDNPAFTAPSLTSVTFTDFEIDSNTIALPALVHLDASTIGMTPGGLFDAPNMTELTSSEIELDPAYTLVTDTLTDIDGSRFAVSGGAGLPAVTAKSYNFSGSSLDANATLLSADGPGSILDLSSLESYTDGQNFSGSQTRTIRATNEGTIDLSKIRSFEGGGGGNDWVRMEVNSGGVVLLNETGGIARTGGFGGRVLFEIENPGSAVEVANLVLEPDVRRLLLDDQASLHVSEGLVFSNTAESEVDMVGGRVVFDDGNYPGRAVLEVGGEELGVGGPASGNFGIGQVIVGGVAETVVLNLVDWKDNGNRAGGAECLYLSGLEGEDGLRVVNGSTVIIPEDVHLYAYTDGVVILLNDLFPPEEDLVAFDEGFLQLGDQSTDVDGDPVETTIRFSVSPNPTAGPLQIEFGLSQVGSVRLELHDVQGRLVRSLIHESRYAKGEHRASWDGRNDQGTPVASGVYFLRLETGSRSQVRRVTLLP